MRCKTRGHPHDQSVAALHNRASGGRASKKGGRSIIEAALRLATGGRAYATGGVPNVWHQSPRNLDHLARGERMHFSGETGEVGGETGDEVGDPSSGVDTSTSDVGIGSPSSVSGAATDASQTERAPLRQVREAARRSACMRILVWLGTPGVRF